MYSSTCILIYVWKGQKDNSQQFKSQSQISFGAFKFSSKTVKVLCYTSAWIKKKKTTVKKTKLMMDSAVHLSTMLIWQ